MSAGKSAIRSVFGQAVSTRGSPLGSTSTLSSRTTAPNPLGQTRSLYNPLASIPFFRRKKETADPRTSFSDPQYLPSTSSSPSSSSSSSSDSNPISTSSIFDQVLEDGTGSGGGSGSGGSGIGEAIDEMRVRERMKKFEDKEGRMFHKYSTSRFKISPRKLNDLGRQISNLPIDGAILQMKFSEKRASERIKSTLVLARNHAVEKGLLGGRLIVAEAWVAKGRFTKRLDIKGRGRHGFRHHPEARLNLVLREGQTKLELMEKKRGEMLSSVRSAGVIREDRPLINSPMSGWRW